MFDVESYCLVPMTVSVDAYTRPGRESQSPSGDAPTKPTSSRGTVPPDGATTVAGIPGSPVQAGRHLG